VTTEATTQKSEAHSERRSVVLLSLAFGVALSAVVALAGTAPRAEAAFTEKVVFASDRTKGTGVNNPPGDYEIFKMNPDGSGLKQLTINLADDLGPYSLRTVRRSPTLARASKPQTQRTTRKSTP